ncbi:MAG: DUF3570 domain-containing protein, partial [Bacteroidetes bacterium]|nr:DUF3570 domain-containing protein [Bacteroidota bacterium]MBU1762193.1 DUF3570 domain-containing protein [Bacteroidota bacterium]
TEKLTDFSNTFDLQLSRYGKTGLKHTYNFEVGFDAYTSASSDNIDPNTRTGPSYSDVRIYPSISWDIANEQKGHSFGFDVSTSHEFDYSSFGGGLHYSKSSKDKNTDFDIKIKAFFDTWKVILPIELRPDNFGGPGYQQNDRAPRNSFSGALSLSHVFTKNFQALIMVEPAYQQGLLATRYQRVYFNNLASRAEYLPDNRLKLPIGARLNYFLGDNLVFRSFLRYYTDDWGIKSETAELETAIKLNPFASISPFYRYYQQSAADYFAAYAKHSANDNFYTSDYDLSKFHSNYYGAGIRFAPPTGVLGISRVSMIELRYGHYTRSNGLNSNIVSINLRFK